MGASDQQFLREYAEHRSEAAFAELVRRHVDFVYSAAVRMVRDAHLAQDVAQGTFVALARNAAKLTERPVLVLIVLGSFFVTWHSLLFRKRSFQHRPSTHAPAQGHNGQSRKAGPGSVVEVTA